MFLFEEETYRKFMLFYHRTLKIFDLYHRLIHEIFHICIGRMLSIVNAHEAQLMRML